MSLPHDAGIEYVVLGSDCTPTAQRCLLETEGDRPALRLHPMKYRIAFKAFRIALVVGNISRKRVPGALGDTEL